MKKDIQIPIVENISFVVAQEITESNEVNYNVYILNLSEDIIEGIIINSKGFGKHPETGEEIKTSTLRHCLELMLPNEAAKVEPIMQEVFGLTNEYHLSFYINSTMYDKKFQFLPNTICEENLETIELLGLKGVMIS